MTRLVGLVLLMGCSSSPAPTCLLDDTIANAPATSCGSLASGADVTLFRAAHDCVVAAIQHQTPFTVRWSAQLIDYGEGDFAMSGTLDQGSYVVQRFGAGADFTGAPYSSARTCSQPADLGACDAIRDTLCVACSDQEQLVCP